MQGLHKGHDIYRLGTEQKEWGFVMPQHSLAYSWEGIEKDSEEISFFLLFSPFSQRATPSFQTLSLVFKHLK